MQPARTFAALLLLTLSTAPLLPQTTSGVLRGTVEDASGARIPGADVSISDAEKSYTRRIHSDDRGEFRVADLPPDTYEVAVTVNGFAEARAKVTVAVSSVREILVTLKPGNVNETVTVDADQSVTSPDLEMASAVHQAVVYRSDLAAIPLAARSFANIAYLAPGTEPVEPSDPTKARITAVSTGGSSGLNNAVSVDGADNTDDYIGGFLQNFSPEALEEFAFRTAQMDADTGGTTAGSVVISTRGGTNDWHGDFSFYGRAEGLNARFPIDNPAPDPKQPFSRQNYAGTIGGPLEKEKLWFFAALEYVHEDASITYSPASRAQFAALSELAADGLVPGASSISVPDSVPVPFRDYLLTARLDWQQSNHSHWFLRGAADTYTEHNALVEQGALPSTGATSHNNYLSVALGNQYSFSPTWVGSLVLAAGGLHLTQTRSETQGFALAFPFTTTSSTITGFETYGDNQFITGIAAFPVLRNQEKYQLRYDGTHYLGRHSLQFGVNVIHEPVLSGALTANAETLLTYTQDPVFYAAHRSAFYADPTCAPPLPASVTCAAKPATDGGFSQNVQRLGFYAEDSWRATPNLTLNYGLRYDTTFGLFIASGRDQSFNPALATGLVHGIPHDYRKAFAPRLGVARTLGAAQKTVLRAGVGLYFDDLAQNGWVTAFQAVNGGTLSGAIASPPPALIDPNYHTPYALHASAGMQHAFSANWLVSADYTHESGMHGYRNYAFPQANVFRSDNRSAYDSLSLRVQGNVAPWAHFTAHYTLAKAQTWGCLLGELFDYVNGVCDPQNPFAPGDYGPSGEDVRHRFVLVGTFQAPGGLQLATLAQVESARPFTLTTPAGDRAVVNGVKTTLDELRGTPFIQADLRVSRPFSFHERFSITPFAEFFNLFNRNNPGANFVTNLSALPIPVNNLSNATALCPTPACAVPITSLDQLRVPAGALGDFFGPGTTVGIPFAAQLGIKLAF
jgi:outer membrane receptor protein involved in Fe transport